MPFTLEYTIDLVRRTDFKTLPREALIEIAEATRRCVIADHLISEAGGDQISGGVDAACENFDVAVDALAEVLRQACLQSVKGETPMRATVVMLKDVKIGDQLVADGGFTCIREGAVVEVKADMLGYRTGDLYVDCDEGRHTLDGQEGDNGELIGFYPAVNIPSVRLVELAPQRIPDSLSEDKL